jgi:D-sedoheptulose 7-phosphate isomerase
MTTENTNRHDRQINEYLDRLAKTMAAVSRSEIGEVIDLLERAYDEGRAVFVMGNGGSAATSSHMVADLNKGVSTGKQRQFRVVSLNDNIPSMMAIANDFGYDRIFVDQIRGLMIPGDLVIGISGSGNSLNVIKAIEYANANGGITIAFTGYTGGKLREIARYRLHVPVEDMQLAEDSHLILNHLIMQALCGILK